jgi:hypothetical protein
MTYAVGGLQPSAERYFPLKVFHFLRVAQKVEHKRKASTMLPQAKE